MLSRGCTFRHCLILICFSTFCTAPNNVGILTASAPCVTLQTPAFTYQNPNYKAENDAVILWQPSIEGASQGQIQVFAANSSMLVSIDLLSALEGATRAVIVDASVGSSGLIALSAVVFNSQREGQWRLLLFDRYGSLMQNVALPRGHAIGKVEVDYDDSVWALGLGDGRVPDNQPVIMKFDAGGALQGCYFRFSDFPAMPRGHEDQMVQEGATFGVTLSRLWIWLPAAKQLRLLMKDGTGVEDYQINDPELNGVVDPQSPPNTMSVLWQEPDEFLVQVAQIISTPQGPVSRTAVLRWTVEDQRWRTVGDANRAISDGILAGVHDGEMIFVSRPANDQNPLIRRVHYR